MFKPFASFFALLVTLQSCASPLAPSSEASTLARYRELFQRHHKELCPAGTEDEFNKLLKAYRGLGFWVPELAGEVDFLTVEKFLPDIERKLAWIQAQKKSLQGRKSLPGLVTITTIEKRIDALLRHKYAWDTEPLGEKKRKAALASAQEMFRLKQDWAKLIRLVPFLTNFAFPVDHLKNRKVHDEFRDKGGAAAQQLANSAFFYRRILEDGAYNPDHTGSDSWLRTTIDTVQLEIDRPMAMLEEDVRYDLEYVLARMKKELERGKPALAARLGEWEERTERTLAFYRDLIRPEGRDAARALVRERNQATLRLKEWVSAKQALSWLWWQRQDELMKALYSIETILYNEVGDVDSKEALERLDVAQVVVNRKDIPFYRSIDPLQEIYPLLRQNLSDEKIQAEHWLNVLYRRGEFSFTYYYMPGAVKAICPDLSRTGLRLQDENLKIGLALLRQPRSEFKALRYFSRASMPGRINMASVWENYFRLPERPGLLAEEQALLAQQRERGELRYLYKFDDPDGVSYHVYQSSKKVYAARPHNGKWVFYSWRNPHYFTYFGYSGNPSLIQ